MILIINLLFHIRDILCKKKKKQKEKETFISTHKVTEEQFLGNEQSRSQISPLRKSEAREKEHVRVDVNKEQLASLREILLSLSSMSNDDK